LFDADIDPDYAFLEGPISALTTSHDYHGGKYKEYGAPATQGMRAFGSVYCVWLTSVCFETYFLIFCRLQINFGIKIIEQLLTPPLA
jgi:hypothetical protein